MNAREEQITARFSNELVEHSRSRELPDGAMSPDEERLLDELMSGEDPVITTGPDGRLVLGESLELSTTCPANCDPDEMDLQFRDANGVLDGMTVAEWLERRADFINKPPNYRDVSGSSDAQAQAIRDSASDPGRPG